MKPYFAVMTLGLLSGCAAFVSGPQQQITINTAPNRATCTLSRQGMLLGEVTTPANAVVTRSKYNISVMCSKPGYQDVAVVNQSGTEPWTWGNILAGGPIGLGIDEGTGAVNLYEPVMNIYLPPAPLNPPAATEPQQSPGWATF
jgi:hypothetical protein